MTQRWLEVVGTELGLDVSFDEAALLEAAREVAHRVERKATPLTTFLIGVAIGKSQTETQLGDICARVTSLAQQWERSRDADRR